MNCLPVGRSALSRVSNPESGPSIKAVNAPRSFLCDPSSRGDGEFRVRRKPLFSLPPPLRKRRRGFWVVFARDSLSDKSESDWIMRADPFEILGLDEDCDENDIKTAFRSKVKEYHPDVYRGSGDSEAITMRLLKAYEFLLDKSKRSTYKRKSGDPFEEPDGLATSLFVNELKCIGKNCPYSCVKRAPKTFYFAETDCARFLKDSEGVDDEYAVQMAVGQCPQECIHYVTNSQRVVLEDILQSVIDGSASVRDVSLLLDGLISRANFENNRDRTPKRKPKSTYKNWVDFY